MNVFAGRRGEAAPSVQKGSGVALEFRPVELLDESFGGVVEQRPALAGDGAAAALAGLDVAGVLELLEGRPDDVSGAVGLALGPDPVAGRAAGRTPVRGPEALDPDGTLVCHLPEQAGGPSGPEVLLLGGQFAAGAGLGVGDPLRLVEFVGDVLGDRLDEVLGGHVVERRHYLLVPVGRV